LSLREALSILDEEVGRLPEKFRVPVVLCYLQGKTNEDAARALGCAAGTLKSRLGRARELLGRRLARRGVALPAGAAAVLLATGAGSAATPPAVAARVAAFSVYETTGASPEAVRLAHQLARAMTVNRVKLWAVGLLALAMIGTGAGVLVRQTAWGGVPPGADAPAKGEVPAEQPSAKADLHGDPLPPGAVARLGTVRLRHGQRANTVGFAAGGKEIVTAGPDGVVRVWDAATGKELRRAGTAPDGRALGEPKDGPTSLSADGSRATTTGADCEVIVWDLRTCKELRRFKHEDKAKFSPITATFTPDGEGVLISRLYGSVKLWDVATGKELRRFQKDSPRARLVGPVEVGGVTFSPDGKWLAAPAELDRSSEDGSIYLGVRLWDVATGKEVRRVGERRKPSPEFDYFGLMICPAFSADDKVLARVAYDGTVRLHDTADGKELHSLGTKGNRDLVAGIVFAPDGKALAALLSDRTVRLYDTATAKELRTLGADPARRPGTGPRPSTFDDPQYSPDAPPLAFAPDGKTLAVATAKNTVCLWDTATGKPLPSPAGHTGAVTELGVAADGKTVVTRGTDRTLRRWDAATGKELGRLRLPPGDGLLNLSPTDRFAAYNIGAGAKIGVWDLAAEKDKVQITMPRPADPLANRALGDPARLYWFSADEMVLADYDSAATVRLWDTATGKQLRAFAAVDESDGQLYALDLSADGSMVLTRAFVAETPGGRATRLRLWDAATGTALRTWETPDAVLAAAFTPDGRAVATAGEQGVSVWELATGKLRFRSAGAAAVVSCSPDGRVLAADGGATIRLLDLRTGKEFRQLKGHQADVEALAFTPDGKRLITGSADSTALVWGGAALAPPALKVEEQSARRLDEVWSDLASSDAGPAFLGAATLFASPKEAVALLVERLKPAAAADARQVARWIADLDDDSFDVREKAAAELGRLGELARPALEEALKKERSAEVRRRVGDLLDHLKPVGALSAEDLRRRRAVEVLEGLGTPEARRLLEELAKGAPGAALTREADAALRRFEK
jgi:WD40 repeat protein